MSENQVEDIDLDLSGQNESSSENKIPVITVQDNHGDNYTFFPISGYTDFLNLLVQEINTAALEIAIEPSLNIRVSDEHTAFIQESVKKQFESGLITEKTSKDLDPVFQAKYEVAFHNLIRAIVQSGQSSVANFYKSQNLIQTPGNMNLNGGVIRS